MSAWRRQALEVLPELRSCIDSAPSPMSLWIELHLAFDSAFDGGDSALVRRILDFAAWCFSERSGPLPNATSTAVACAFYEHLVTRKDYLPHLGAWLDPVQFHRLLPVFSYHLTPAEVAELEAAYRSSRQAR